MIETLLYAYKICSETLKGRKSKVYTESLVLIDDNENGFLLDLHWLNIQLM